MHFTSLCFGQTISIENLNSEEVDNKMQLIKIGDLNVKSASCEYLWICEILQTVDNLIIPAEEIKGEFVFDGSKEYCSQNGIKSYVTRESDISKAQFISKSVFDGEITNSYQISRRLPNGIYEVNGTRNRNGNSVWIIVNPMKNIGAINNNDLFNYFNSENRKLTHRYNGEVVVNSVVCDLFQSAIANSDTTITVALAVNMLMRPVRIDIDTEYFKIMININYFVSENGYIFPKHKTIDFYSKSKSASSPDILVYKHRITFSNPIINTLIPTSIFNIKYPRGSKIYDHANRTIVTIE